MATGSVTKRVVDGLTSAGADTFLWDNALRGFGVKVTPTGTKSYIYSYRLGGREAPKRRHTIGRHGSPWTPDSARAEAKRLSILVAQGVDPVEADKQRRRDAVDLAFGPYTERFIETYLSKEWPGTWELAAGLLRRDAIPAFARRSLNQIKRNDIATLMDSMADRPGSRRNLFTVMRRMFRWAINRGDLVESPLRDMDPPPAPASRDRVLSDAELALVWSAAGTLDFPFGPFFQMLIATGQRREEVAGLTWKELDRASATWTLPAARAKNDQAHTVPLNEPALAVLDALARLLADDEAGPLKWPRKGLVFTTTRKTPISGHSRAKRRLDETVAKLEADAAKKEGRDVEPVDPWRMHDLRRTLATGLQRLGVRFEVTESVLNHVSGSRSGVAGVYQRHDWKVEKRAALDAWGGHIANLTPQEAR